MKSIFTYALVAAAWFGAVSGAVAGDIKPKMPTDLRCLTIGTMMAASTEQQVRSFGVVMSIYYLGRIDGSGQGANIGTKIQAEGVLLVDQNIQDDQAKCRALLGVRSKALADISSTSPPKH